eukprot:6603776-Pyramimonas_sp.AAC.1
MANGKIIITSGINMCMTHNMQSSIKDFRVQSTLKKSICKSLALGILLKTAQSDSSAIHTVGINL